jgi:LDH2 family malate/lactate/ureidoglycolate dehydrogenase
MGDFRMKLAQMAWLLHCDPENISVVMYVNKLKQQKGFQEVLVPAELIDKIEEECDREGIPCYKVTDNLLSTHDTYFELYYAEKSR